TGVGPQLNVTTPPFMTAVCSALKLQLDADPLPTTVVGVELSAAWPFAGKPALHAPFGFPACPADPPVAGVPPVPRVPAVPVVP
ncbi:MAG: hypothetical protein ABUS79_06020, partial [Pseudomonadota bacterium]